VTRPPLPRPRTLDRRHLLPGLAAFLAALAVALVGLRASADPPAPPPPTGKVTVRLLGINDLHGHLEPPAAGIGGVAWVKAHLDRDTLPGRTIRVHAGDMVGASPLISSWFHDEPAIESANGLGFDVGTVGNHEFDEGGDELLRLLRGGRRTGPEALKRDAGGRLVNTSSPSFGGAGFPYVAANTFERDGDRLLLPPFAIVERAGARVGFIGVTTPSTPTWVLPRFAARFRFTDISDAVNRWVPELRRRGVEAIVVLAHEGAPAQDGGDAPQATGPIVEETRQMDDAVDVVIAGHSHSKINLRLPNASGRGDKLIVEAASYGTAYDRVDMTIDRASGDVVAKAGSVPATAHAGVEPAAGLRALVGRYARRVAPLGEHVVGESPVALTRRDGNLAALAAGAQRAFANADVALVNPGSLRADVDPGPIAYAELFQAQAYDHRLMRRELTGDQLAALLERFGDGVAVAGVERGSGGAAPTLAGGRPLEPGTGYTVVANELFATGGSFPAGSWTPAGGSEVEALAGAFGRSPWASPPVPDRASRRSGSKR
jgi:5'-nucleotidase